jgi:hypothetical protein
MEAAPHPNFSLRTKFGLSPQAGRGEASPVNSGKKAD